MGPKKLGLLCALGIAVATALGAHDARAQHVMHEWIPTPASGALGHAVTFIGDVNSDGHDDVALGAPHPSDPTSYSQVLIRSGADGSLVETILGEQPNDGFGIYVAGLGDVNLDGHPDIAVSSNTGYVRVISGKDWTLLKRLSHSSGSTTFGRPLAAVGDVNLDGYKDLLTSDPAANGNTGEVYLFSGKTWINLITLSGEHVGETFGAAISPAGDVNGDDVPDIAVSAPNWLHGQKDGRIYLYTGPYLTRYITHDGSTNEELGVALAAAGDVNGDGFDDVLAGGRRQGSGIALVVSGFDGSRLRDWSAVYSGGRFGDAVASVGDVDGDSVPDVCIGSPRDDGYSGTNGRVYIHSGKTSAILRSINLPGDADWGTTLASGGDADGDGHHDLLIGGPFTLGHAVLHSVAFLPNVFSVSPTRGHYEGGTTVTIKGEHFAGWHVIEAFIGGVQCTGVVVIDDNTIQCVTGRMQPGHLVDVTVHSDMGTRSLTASFKCTPFILDPTGEFTPNGSIVTTYLCKPHDTLFGFFGLDSSSIPVRPYDGTLGIFPYVTHFMTNDWKFDQYVLDDIIPDDPDLVGLTVHIQALIGPALGGRDKDGAFTNVVSVTIE